MKTTNFKTMLAAVGAVLLLAAALISSQSPASALTFDKKQGQDVSGKNCERVDTAESSTFGKCENVCKDKEVTRDAENNRWVCKATKAAVSRPGIDRAPVVGAVKDSGAAPKPRRQTQADSKTAKSKKN